MSHGPWHCVPTRCRASAAADRRACPAASDSAGRGSFSSALLMMSSSFGRNLGIQPHRGNRRLGSGSRRRWLRWCRPRNGIAPVTISYSTAPKENRSVRASSSLPARLLRRHVRDRAHRRAWTGQVLLRNGYYGRCGRTPHLRLPLRCSYLRQSKIQNLGVPALGDKDVGRLDVAMNDALRVRGVQCVGNLRSPKSRDLFELASACHRCRCFSVTPSRYSMAMNGRPWSSSIS